MKVVLAGAACARATMEPRVFSVGLVLATTLVALAASFERSAWPSRAADHTLVGAVFGVAIPVFAYACTSRATRGGLAERLEPLARYGADRRRACLGYVAYWGGVLALASGWLALVGVVVARGVSDPGLLSDCVVSARVALLGGGVYATWFSVGATLPRPRLWQLAVLAGDWTLGSTTTAASAVWPRSHLRTLLGTEPVLGLSQSGSTLALWGMAAVALAFSMLRLRR